MKKSIIILLFFVSVTLMVATIIFVVANKNNKSEQTKKLTTEIRESTKFEQITEGNPNINKSEQTTNSTTEFRESTKIEQITDGNPNINETEKTTRKHQGSLSGVSYEKTEEWEELYLNFVKNEKSNPQYANSEFKYAFVECVGFKYPVLLLKDTWNMYLFYIDNNKVVSATDKDGYDFPLHRMSDAYTENGKLYMYGSCGSPTAFYYCEVKHKDYFYLEYFAEGHYTPKGKVTYHQNGNPLTEEEYNDAVSLHIKNATTVVFI